MRGIYETGKRKGNRRGLIYVSLILLCFVFLFSTGCEKREAVPEEPVKQHLNYLLPSVPRLVDPARLEDETGFQFTTGLFEGLVRLEPDGSLAKALAQDWQVTDNGQKYVFSLRETEWSDGTKVTAYDFANGIKRNLALGENCPYAYLLYDIKNAEAYHRSQSINYNGKIIAAELVGIKALDEQTLAIELEKKDPAFLKKLVHPVFYPLPPAALEDKDGRFFTPTGLIGNGPFQVVREIPNEGYELVKNPHYWEKDRIKLESMKWVLPKGTEEDWQLFKKKQIDLTANIPFSFVEEGLKKGALKSSPLLTTYYYQCNTTEKPLSDPKIRQALSLSLNRETLITEFLKGGQLPAQGIIPQGMPESLAGTDFRLQSKVKIPNANEQQARELLAAAGYQEGQGFPKLELMTGDGVGHRYFAEKIQQEWQNKLGIKVEITALPWPELMQRMKDRSYQIGLMGWSADYADPQPYFQPFITGSGNNMTGWVNYNFDELLKSAANADNETERISAFHGAEEILLSELPVLPLYQYTKVYAVRENVRGIFAPSLGTGFDFKTVFVAKPGD